MSSSSLRAACGRWGTIEVGHLEQVRYHVFEVLQCLRGMRRSMKATIFVFVHLQFLAQDNDVLFLYVMLRAAARNMVLQCILLLKMM